jgi:hypothetical protein
MGKLKELLIDRLYEVEVERKDYYYRLGEELSSNGFSEKALELMNEMKYKGYTDEVDCAVYDYNAMVLSTLD